MNLIQSSTANAIAKVTARMTVSVQAVLDGLEQRASDRERGDVPGWVLITLMTAGLVTILWTLAAEQMRTLFTTAIQSVTGPGAP